MRSIQGNQLCNLQPHWKKWCWTVTVYWMYGPHSHCVREAGYSGKHDVSICLAFCLYSSFYPRLALNHSKWLQASYFQYMHCHLQWHISRLELGSKWAFHQPYPSFIWYFRDWQFTHWNQGWSRYLRAKWGVSHSWMLLFLGLAEHTEEFSLFFCSHI